jgi:DNA-binding transcriptional MerR regulator
VAQLLIGDIARRTGIAATTIRYYETLGLLTPPVRTSGGYRKYGESTVDDLQFIKKAQALGFSLDEVGEILKLSRSGETPCTHVLHLAQRHLAAVGERIRQLTRFRDQLSAEITKWDGPAQADCQGYCQIIANADIDTTAVNALSTQPVTLHRPSQKKDKHVV